MNRIYVGKDYNRYGIHQHLERLYHGNNYRWCISDDILFVSFGDNDVISKKVGENISITFDGVPCSRCGSTNEPSFFVDYSDKITWFKRVMLDRAGLTVDNQSIKITIDDEFTYMAKAKGKYGSRRHIQTMPYCRFTAHATITDSTLLALATSRSRDRSNDTPNGIIGKGGAYGVGMLLEAKGN